MNFDTKYDFGDLLKDNVTGFEGVVMVKALYSTGCLHYGLSPQKISIEQDTPKDPSWLWYDESRLSLSKKGVVKFQINDDSYKAISGPAQTKQQVTQINSI